MLTIKQNIKNIEENNINNSSNNNDNDIFIRKKN